MRYLSYFLTLALILSMNTIFAQPANTPTGTAKKDAVTQYYRLFIEHFYKEDEFIGLIEEPKEAPNFFVVKKNQKDKAISIGYYTRKGDSQDQKTLGLTQYVNFEGLAYYYLTYTYNSKDQLTKKEFKDQDDAVIAYYKYIWNGRTNELRKVEKYGKTPYLGKMELKSINEYTWDGNKLKTFTFFDKMRRPVEKYYFIENPNTGENKDPIYVVGNNIISMFRLEKYERYRVGSKSRERSFYVKYKRENKMIVQEKYNHDDVLIEEAPPIEIPEEALDSAAGEGTNP